MIKLATRKKCSLFREYIQEIRASPLNLRRLCMVLYVMTCIVLVIFVWCEVCMVVLFMYSKKWFKHMIDFRVQLQGPIWSEFLQVHSRIICNQMYENFVMLMPCSIKFNFFCKRYVCVEDMYDPQRMLPEPSCWFTVIRKGSNVFIVI